MAAWKILCETLVIWCHLHGKSLEHLLKWGLIVPWKSRLMSRPYAEFPGDDKVDPDEKTWHGWIWSPPVNPCKSEVSGKSWMIRARSNNASLIPDIRWRKWEKTGDQLTSAKTHPSGERKRFSALMSLWITRLECLSFTVLSFTKKQRERRRLNEL